MRPSKKVATLLFTPLLIAALLAGCSNESYSQSTMADYGGYATEEATPAAAPEPGYYDEAAEGGAAPTLTEPQDDRMVILNASLSIEALDFTATCQALQDAATEAGGYTAGTYVSGSSEYKDRYASFTFRVPAANYTEFLTKAGESGNMTSRSESSEDVTAEYVDIEARLTALRTQEERLTALLEESGSLEELLQVQTQLSEVQYEIERYTGLQRALDGQISYSTVTVDVYEVTQESAPEPETFGERLGRSFADSLANTATFFQELAVALVYLLPFLLILGVIALVVLLLVRRSAKKRKERLAKNPPPKPQPIPTGYGWYNWQPPTYPYAQPAPQQPDAQQAAAPQAVAQPGETPPTTDETPPQNSNPTDSPE